MMDRLVCDAANPDVGIRTSAADNYSASDDNTVSRLRRQTTIRYVEEDLQMN